MNFIELLEQHEFETQNRNMLFVHIDSHLINSNQHLTSEITSTNLMLETIEFQNHEKFIKEQFELQKKQNLEKQNLYMKILLNQRNCEAQNLLIEVELTKLNREINRIKNLLNLEVQLQKNRAAEIEEDDEEEEEFIV